MSKRATFVFSEDAVRRLERLRLDSQLATRTNVIRHALLVLEDLLRALKRGETIIVRRKDGTQREYDPLPGSQ